MIAHQAQQRSSTTTIAHATFSFDLPLQLEPSLVAVRLHVFDYADLKWRHQTKLAKCGCSWQWFIGTKRANSMPSLYQEKQ